MVVEPAPTAAQNGLALAKDVVGEAETRLPECSPRRKSAQRNAGITRVPQESAVVACGLHDELYFE